MTHLTTTDPDHPFDTPELRETRSRQRRQLSSIPASMLARHVQGLPRDLDMPHAERRFRAVADAALTAELQVAVEALQSRLESSQAIRVTLAAADMAHDQLDYVLARIHDQFRPDVSDSRYLPQHLAEEFNIWAYALLLAECSIGGAFLAEVGLERVER